LAQVLASYTPGSIGLLEAAASPGISRFFDVEPVKEASPSDDPVTSRYDGNLWLVHTTDDADQDDTSANRAIAENTIRQLRGMFDYVLIDAPPSVYGSWALPLATSADGVVLVVKAGETRRDAVQIAIRQLEVIGGKLLGTVLNQQEQRIPDAIYKRL
jgi:MinD-like ATPase involved in chromosome partitioning or flagellar assembly